MKLHEKQLKLLGFLKDRQNLDGISLWQIARETGLNNAQTVSHHLQQLEKRGYLRRNLSDPKSFEVLKDPVEDVVYINLYGFAQCGNEAEFFSEGNLEDNVAISTKLFGIKDYLKTFLVKAKGDSMSPYIRENDLVLIQEQNDIDDGSLGLIIDNEEPKIKKLYKNHEGKFILNSFNPKYKDKIVSGESLRILGAVKGVIQGFQ